MKYFSKRDVLTGKDEQTIIDETGFSLSVEFLRNQGFDVSFVRETKLHLSIAVPPSRPLHVDWESIQVGNEASIENISKNYERAGEPGFPVGEQILFELDDFRSAGSRAPGTREIELLEDFESRLESSDYAVRHRCNKMEDELGNIIDPRDAREDYLAALRQKKAGRPLTQKQKEILEKVDRIAEQTTSAASAPEEGPELSDLLLPKGP